MSPVCHWAQDTAWFYFSYPLLLSYIIDYKNTLLGMSAYVSQNIYYQILKKCSKGYSVAVKTIITFGRELDVAQKKNMYV